MKARLLLPVRSTKEPACVSSCPQKSNKSCHEQRRTTMRARILITDDDAISCRLLTKVLQEEHYQSDWAPSAEDALRRLTEEHYDLLVIDVRLPGMTGLEVTRILKKEY